jgi:putative transposase
MITYLIRTNIILKIKIFEKAMAKVKIWLHIVWGTKNREPVLEKGLRPKLFQHILENARSKGIYLDFINGEADHVHCLATLNADMPVSKMLNLIKGEASHWANSNKIFRHKLEWADEYFAVSVSESQVEAVRNYIKNQEEHHKKYSFSAEYELFLKKFNFDKN